MAKKKRSKKAARPNVKARTKPKPKRRTRQKRIAGQQAKSGTHTDKNKFRNVDISIGAVKHHIAVARHGLENQLKDQMLRQYNATTKTAKRKIGKKIAELKSKINKLK